ncbi:MAG: hypothetical protein ACERKK_07520 [Poseidonibacter sp.]|uniref:hypothetical protein n=1 Tax=Poseidonibacter sp. TaxID=2321188 RepID=UPI00359E4B6D
MKSKDEIQEWLKENSINNFTISSDLYVTVHSNVNLNGKIHTPKLPVKFKSVNGYFDISNNGLESLEGCPETVMKDFNCSHNKLTSLLGAPSRVGDFDCSHNQLKNLSYCPKEVLGFFNCSFNQITSIKGSPRTIRGFYNASDNHIESLKGGPKYIDTNFNCSSNDLEELIGGPITVGHDYICNKNKLRDLENVADEIGWDLITDIRLSHITSAFDEEEKSWRYKGSEVIAHIYKPIVALSNKDDIAKWLNRHEIRDYHILQDNSVDVNGNVRLSGKLANLLKLPLSFNEIHGSFDISDNELVSLEGSPKKVTGDFMCHKNEISSLKGGPKEVEGSFIILHNNISSLNYAPAIVKEDFICSHNPLRDLEGLNLVHGSVFTGVEIPSIKCQKYVYNSVATFKYVGEAVMQYLDKVYVSLTDEEKKFEKTKLNLKNAMLKMLNTNNLKKEMITDTLINNLTKYHLNDIKEKVLKIKNPPRKKNISDLTEDEILSMAFDSEL